MAETADPILEDFKNHLSFERQLSQNTLTAYVADAAHYLEYCAANELPPEAVPPQFLDQYAYQLRVVENLSAASVFRKLEAVKSFYKFLLIEGRITEDPTRFLKSPKLPQRMPEQLSRQDMERLLSYPAEKFDEVRTLTMVELLYAAGLRVSELINLQLENVNLNEGWVLALGKGGKQRFVPLHHLLPAAEILSVRERGAFCRQNGYRFGTVLKQPWQKNQPPVRMERPGRAGPQGGYFPAAAPAFIPPYFCQPPAAGRGGSAQSAGNAGAFQPGHHPDLHAFGRQRPESQA